MIIEVHSEEEMKQFGARLGALLRGGETIELVGDVGAGKTTLTKGIASGMKVEEDVQSPSFTISRVYEADRGLELAHYDFYRLHDAGIMANELHETLHNPRSVTIIEWADIIKGILPKDHLRIQLTSPTEATRRVEVAAGGAKSSALVEQLA
ncbi:tRNA threonylcarbamoyladenosine biosynthesis protein TsaE [compost metagenome]